MAITLTSVFGGVTDPYEDEGPVTDTALQFDAIYEQTDFLDRVDIDLTPSTPGPAYIQITNIEVGVAVEGLVVTFNDLTDNTATEINFTYTAPAVDANVLSDVDIVTNIFNANTEANVEIFGIVNNAFPDKFFDYVNLLNNQNVRVVGLDNVPNSNVNLHLYKASLMRHNSILFFLNVEYDSTTTESFVLQKRVLNDWELGRLALIDKLETIGI